LNEIVDIFAHNFLLLSCCRCNKHCVAVDKSNFLQMEPLLSDLRDALLLLELLLSDLNGALPLPKRLLGVLGSVFPLPAPS
jgi:hypothetical protein